VSLEGSKGFFVEPTIFRDVRNDMKIAREEIFGPVLATLPFDDLDGPIVRITALDTPVPFSPPLEHFFLPKVEDVVREARKLHAY